MPVNSRHKDYEKSELMWRIARDVTQGELAVKEAGPLYLPRLTGQSDEEYQAYKRRALFYDATSRTVSGLAGAVMLKQPVVVVPTLQDEKYIESVGSSGESLFSLLKESVEEVLTMGRIGVLVDADQSESAEPYFALYHCERIVNWRTAFVNHENRLVLLVLEEFVDECDDDDDFVCKTKEQYRVLRLVNEGESWVYQVEVWRRSDKATDQGKNQGFVLVDGPIVPRTRGGKTFDEIPFFIINSSKLGVEVERPPILGLAQVNLSHYRTSADLEHGNHWCALPQPWVSGLDIGNQEARIGSGTAWVMSDPQARAGYLEFSGTGLQSLERALDRKEKLMAVLGARLLEDQKRGVEAYETVRLRHNGENSALSSIANSVSVGFTRALQSLFGWLGRDDAEVSVELNTDYSPAGIDPQVLVSLMSAVQSNLISFDTWFYNLKRGEIVPNNRTEEDERALIELGIPMGSPVEGQGDAEFGSDDDEDGE